MNKGKDRSYLFGNVVFVLLGISITGFVMTSFYPVLGLPVEAQAFFWTIGLWIGLALLFVIVCALLFSAVTSGAQWIKGATDGRPEPRL